MRLIRNRQEPAAELERGRKRGPRGGLPCLLQPTSAPPPGPPAARGRCPQGCWGQTLRWPRDLDRATSLSWKQGASDRFVGRIEWRPRKWHRGSLSPLLCFLPLSGVVATQRSRADWPAGTGPEAGSAQGGSGSRLLTWGWGVGNSSPCTLESGLAAEWCGPWAEVTAAAHGHFPRRPPPRLAAQLSCARLTGDSGLQSRASSSGVTFPCDTRRASDGRRNGAAALHPSDTGPRPLFLGPSVFQTNGVLAESAHAARRCDAGSGQILLPRGLCGNSSNATRCQLSKPRGLEPTERSARYLKDEARAPHRGSGSRSLWSTRGRRRLFPDTSVKKVLPLLGFFVSDFF